MTDREGAGAPVLPEIRDMTGPAALPRTNGDLVFDAPWQGRAFGTAIATARHLGLEWDEFRRRLIETIADAPDRPYYDAWVVALEHLVIDRGLVSAGEIDARAATLDE